MKMMWKNWPVEAVIIEKRGSNLIKTNDRAGKFTDPYTNMTGYKLQKSKDTIPIVNYDWVLHNTFVPNTFFEKFVALLRGNIGTIFLFRYGSKQYKPINIKENEKNKVTYKEVVGSDGKPVFINVYQQLDPREKLGALDFEVVDWDNMNFMVQEQSASIVRRQKNKQFLKEVLMPLGAMAMAALVCIIMIKFSYDYAIVMKNSGGSSPAPKPAERPNIPVVGDIVPGK